MQNLIDKITQLLEADQNCLVQTRHKVGDLRVLFTDMQAGYVKFRSDYTALETQHKTDMAEFRTTINPLLTALNESRQRIHENDAQLRTNKEKLERAINCSRNCDSEFVGKVMNEIKRSLRENNMDVDDFGSEFQRVQNEIDSFKTTDDRIIAEFNTVLIELGKLDSLSVTSPPFQPFDLINDTLNETSATLERKREDLARLNVERADKMRELITQRNTNHENQTTLFDGILHLIRTRSADLTNRFALMIPQDNRIRADLDNLNISLGLLPNRINQVLLNNNLNGSQAHTFGIIFLVGVVFLIFFLDCFITK